MASTYSHHVIFIGIIVSILTSHCFAANFNWTEKSTGKVCILVDSDFTVEISVKKNDGSVNSRSFVSNSTDIQTSGQCGSTSTLNLYYPTSLLWGIIFKDDNQGTVSLTHLIQFVPRKLFEDKTLSADTFTFKDPKNVRISRDDESFLCRVPDHSEYTPETVSSDSNFSVSVTVDAIQAQAFGITDDKFSSPNECKQDNVTTTPETPTTDPSTTNHTGTTDTTPTTPSGGVPLNRYAVQPNVPGTNKTCIVLEGKLSFVIPYEYERKDEDLTTKVVTIPVESTATWKGVCLEGFDKQTLSIFFRRKWQLTFEFTKKKKGKKPEEEDEVFSNSFTKKQMTQGDMDYKISKLTLRYKLESDIFKHSKLPHNTTITVSSDEEDLPRKFSGKDFYGCNRQLVFTLKNNQTESSVLLKTDELKFKAFNDNDKSDFEGKISECAADDDSDHKVAIIVGSVMGGLVLIIIIIYVALRCRQREGYNEI